MQINSSQIRTRHGVKVNGSVIYGQLDSILNAKVFTTKKENNVSFTLGADADVFELGTNKPTGEYYIDGSTYEAINGGIAVEPINGLGTASNNITVVASQPMIGKLYTKDGNDEVLIETKDTDGIVVGKKLVYVSIQADQNSTNVADGNTIGDDETQITFLTIDDAQKKLVPTVIPSGDYQFSYNNIWTMNTLTTSSGGFSGWGDVDDIGSFALDELFPQATIEHGYLEGVITDDVANKSDNTIIFKDDGKLYNTDNAEIGTWTGAFPKIKGNDVGNNFGTKGLFADYNGVAIKQSGSTMSATDQLDVVLDSISGGYLWKDDEINIKW